MANISLISYTENIHKPYSVNICGRNIICTGAFRTRRKLKRFISGFGIERTAISGNAPDFILTELARRGVKYCNGEKLLQKIYPQLISRAAKTNKDTQCCTVYDTFADEDTFKIIEYAAEHFKYVALSAENDISHIAERIMESTGLALKSGEAGGVGILHRGCICKNMKVNLTASSTLTFSDENNSIISSATAEAIAGDNIDSKVLERLNLKIHSLC